MLSHPFFPSQRDDPQSLAGVHTPRRIRVADKLFPRHREDRAEYPRAMSDRAVSPPRRDTLKELKEAEADLQAARQEAAAAQSRVAELERKANDVRVKVSAARSMALLSVRPRRLVIAYALWLFTPLIWPGAYLFYLGRDTHAVLHTVSLGGFGIGWLLDAFYIPLYVADHNEPPGYLDRVTSGTRGIFSKLLGKIR